VFFHAFLISNYPVVNRQLVDAGLAAPTFVFSDWLSMWPKLSSTAMTSPPHVIHQGPYGPCYTQPSLRMLHGFCHRKTTPSWYLPTWCIRFCDVSHPAVSWRWTSTVSSAGVIWHHIPQTFFRSPWQNDTFASRKFLFIANKKQKTLQIRHC